MDKKSILFIHPFFPYPLKSGGHQALFNGIFAVKDDLDIYLAYETFESEEYDKAQEAFMEQIPNAHLLPLIRKKKKETKPSCISILLSKIIKKIKSLYNRLHKSTDVKSNPIREMGERWNHFAWPKDEGWASHIDKICNDYSFDIIQVEMPWMISIVLSLPKTSQKIHVHHELGFVRRQFEYDKYPENPYLNSCKRYSDLNEVFQLNMYDMVLTLSPVDTQKLISAGVNVPVRSSFSIVDSSLGENKKVCWNKCLSFIGSGDHWPNVTGLEWFCKNCWTKIRKMDPEIKLKIIGMWPQSLVHKFKKQYKEIEFLGFVDNISEAMQGTIMIVPILEGSGIRMKILEACVNGIPFVSTYVGAEGIPLIHGEHCFIADKPEEFISCVLQLRDENLQSQFIVNARRLVEEKYSLVALRKNRIEIYQELLGLDSI